MSTPQRVDVSESVWPDSTILHEIDWCERRICVLQLELQRKPSKIREINDLKRQIEDKKSVLAYRSGK
jgi:hypothetical protein